MRVHLAGISFILSIACAPWLSARTAIRSVVDLQPQRTDVILDLVTKDTTKAGFVRLVNLNPNVNAWYLLDVTWPGATQSKKFHLENPEPSGRLIFLDKRHPNGLRIMTRGTEYICDLWAPEQNSELKDVDIEKKTYGSICGGRLFVRNQLEGNESTKEWVADFLRRNVWGGEEITTLVKDYLYKDKFLIKGEVEKQQASESPNATPGSIIGPLAAKVDPKHKGATIFAKEMGIGVNEVGIEAMRAGIWYETKAKKGVYVSVMEAQLIQPDIMTSFRNLVQPLDKIENEALTYFVAFDLSKFDLGFALGTLHPSAEWSDRANEKVRTKGWLGPDGVGDFLPLKLTGKVNPTLANKVIATFTAGFKRTHGAFKWGKLSTVNGGSHYGFIENGVVFSKLQPNLATIYVTAENSVEMKTWTEADNKLLPDIKHARQNGVPIIDFDATKKEGIPGTLVSNWMAGNWSGSVDSKQRALRAAVCLQEHHGQRYLIYGYFSSVTPNAMARLFQSYSCSYAIHLDMNALEHTYLAIYETSAKMFKIEHLITGMNVLDKKSKDQVVPRFVGTADNRDFFYVMQK